MHLTRAEIYDFKNILAAKLELSGITVLTGENGCGKTSVFEALEFVFRLIHADEEDRKGMLTVKQYRPEIKDCCLDDFRIILQFASGSSSEMIRYSLCIQWNRESDTPGSIKEEYLEYQNGNGNWISLAKRDERKVTVYRDHHDRLYKTENIGNFQLMISELAETKDWLYSSLAKELASFQICNNRTGLQESDQFFQELFSLEEDQPGNFTRIEDAFCQLFPRTQKISLKDSDSPTVSLKDRYLVSEIPFEQWPLSQQQVFTALAKAMMAAAAGCRCLIVECPEAGLFPGLLGPYLDLLSQLSGEQCVLLISTCSPYVINTAGCLNTKTGILQPNGKSVFYGFDPDNAERFEEYSWNLDETPGEMLFGLLSGDEDDHLFLESFLNKDK